MRIRCSKTFCLLIAKKAEPRHSPGLDEVDRLFSHARHSRWLLPQQRPANEHVLAVLHGHCVSPAAIRSSNTTRQLGGPQSLYKRHASVDLCIWILDQFRQVHERLLVPNSQSANDSSRCSSGFLAGEFGAQRSTKPFAQVAVDQTIEQTMNRHRKMRKGGTVGFSKLNHNQQLSAGS